MLGNSPEDKGKRGVIADREMILNAVARTVQEAIESRADELFDAGKNDPEYKEEVPVKDKFNFLKNVEVRDISFQHEDKHPFWIVNNVTHEHIEVSNRDTRTELRGGPLRKIITEAQIADPDQSAYDAIAAATLGLQSSLMVYLKTSPQVSDNWEMTGKHFEIFFETLIKICREKISKGGDPKNSGFMKDIDIGALYDSTKELAKKEEEKAERKFRTLSSSELAKEMKVSADCLSIPDKEVTFELCVSKKMSMEEAEQFRTEFLGGNVVPAVKLESQAPGARHSRGFKKDESRIVAWHVEIGDIDNGPLKKSRPPVTEKTFVNFCMETSRTAEGKYQGMVYMRPGVREDQSQLLLLPAWVALGNYKKNQDLREKNDPIKITGANPLMVAVMIELCRYRTDILGEPGYQTEVPKRPSDEIMEQARLIVDKLPGGLPPRPSAVSSPIPK